MFIRIAKTIYYVEFRGEPVEIQGIRSDLGTKFLTADGKEYPMWPISPKRIKILEYLAYNPKSSVTNISFSLQFPFTQEVNSTIAYFKHKNGPLLVWSEEWGRWSILKEKEEEILKFVEDFRANKVRMIEKEVKT